MGLGLAWKRNIVTCGRVRPLEPGYLLLRCLLLLLQISILNQGSRNIQADSSLVKYLESPSLVLNNFPSESSIIVTSTSSSSLLKLYSYITAPRYLSAFLCHLGISQTYLLELLLYVKVPSEHSSRTDMLSSSLVWISQDGFFIGSNQPAHLDRE